MTFLERFHRFLIAKSYSLKDVFTPTTAATLNYLHREGIENQIKSSLTQPGKQLILYGHSGSGKTTIWRSLFKELELNPIITNCSKDTTFDKLMLTAFDKLNPYFVYKKDISKSLSKKIDFSTEYSIIKNQISANLNSTNTVSIQRLLPPQLTPQKLAELLGASNVIWVIEDFHKLDIDNKQKLADILKIFVDISNDYPNTKILCIGAADTAHEIIQLDSNLKNRVDEIHVPLLNDEEIKQIVERGCELLNITMSTDLVDKIVYYSYRLASIAHQMCYVMCSSNGIEAEKVISKIEIDDEKFSIAVKDYINSNSDTFKSVYYESTKESLGWYILKTFAEHGNEKLSFVEIVQRVSTRSHYFSSDEIKEKLDEFITTENGPVHYIQSYDRYTLSSPFLKAFLKMQLAIEKSEREKAKQNRNNKHLSLYNSKDKDAIVYYEILKFINENSMYNK